MIVLIYDKGDQFTQDIETKTFSTEPEMIDFVNKENIGYSVHSCYQVIKEIDIEPFEKVTEYRIKS